MLENFRTGLVRVCWRVVGLCVWVTGECIWRVGGSLRSVGSRWWSWTGGRELRRSTVGVRSLRVSSGSAEASTSLSRARGREEICVSGGGRGVDSERRGVNSERRGVNSGRRGVNSAEAKSVPKLGRKIN